jgi:hypothetical protein
LNPGREHRSHIPWDRPLVLNRNVTRPILAEKRNPVIHPEARGFTD